MVQSALVTRTVPHHNKFGSRDGRPITRVIQHHWAGPGGDARLANPGQQASSNYLIYSDGSIAVQVPEEYRAWTSGSYEADVNSITIEVENSSYQKHGNDNHPDSWAISDAAYRSIINLLADVARRYGWGSITNDRYRGHREFSPTACPGGYLWARMADIRAQANAVLSGGGITTVGTTEEEELNKDQDSALSATWKNSNRILQIAEALDVNVNGQGKVNQLINTVNNLAAAVGKPDVDVEKIIRDSMAETASSHYVKAEGNDSVYALIVETGELRPVKLPEWNVANAAGIPLRIVPQKFIDNAKKVDA